MTDQATIKYETEVCGRCGGSGRYSYNQMDGDRCYGCGGSGNRLTKRGRAAREYATSILEVSVEVYHDQHQGQPALYTDFVAGKRIRFYQTRETESGAAHIVNGKRIPIRCFTFLRKDGTLQGVFRPQMRVYYHNDRHGLLFETLTKPIRCRSRKRAIALAKEWKASPEGIAEIDAAMKRITSNTENTITP